ncbi:MAG: Tex family protein [Bacilli bacterium]
MDIIQTLSTELEITTQQVTTVINLLQEGNTIPFIARYRKEMTGSLDDEVLRTFDIRYKYLLNFNERLATITKTITELEKMTPEIEMALQNATTLAELEDIYRPYKPKRETRGTKAIKAGLAPLAEIIKAQADERPLEEIASEFLNEEHQITDVNLAILGALDIIAEEIADEASYRKQIRLIIKHFGKIITAQAGDDENEVYQMYYDYQEAVASIRPHRILAINRGEKQKVLKVNLIINDDDALSYIERGVLQTQGRFHEELKKAIADSYKRLIFPSLTTEIRNELFESAEDVSMKVFQANLRQLLLEPPLSGVRILGFDPAFRTGCKLAVINEHGAVLDKAVIYPTVPHKNIAGASKKLLELITEHRVDYIALGNGTASRESEQFLRHFLNENSLPTKYVIVSEAGASVYSASKLGAEEFPDYETEERSAVSIARRLLDPLAELVKIDPKAIGVGQYQHDMNQKKLSERLHVVVEDVVNAVGVNLNQASVSLLTYVSGISNTVAKNIVAYRHAHGPFLSREQLLKVPQLGPKAFEQCAGFLRLEGENILDNTAVHPESYPLVEKLLTDLGLSLSEIGTEKFNQILPMVDIGKYAKKLEIGEPTLTDIIEELQKPGRDPRLEIKTAQLQHTITDIKDLKEGMILEGTVRNLMDFGAFVDIGVHCDGLVHISEIANRFIKHPLDVLSINQVVKVKVIGVDLKRKRISLSMKQVS